MTFFSPSKMFIELAVFNVKLYLFVQHIYNRTDNTALVFFPPFAKVWCKNSLRGFLASNNFREISFPNTLSM